MCIEFRYMNYSEQHQLLHLTVCCWLQEVTSQGTNTVQAVYFSCTNSEQWTASATTPHSLLMVTGTNVVKLFNFSGSNLPRVYVPTEFTCFFLNALLIFLYFFSSSAAPQKPANGTVPFRVASNLGTDRVCCVLERCRILNLGLLHRSQVRYHWDSSPSRIYL